MIDKESNEKESIIEIAKVKDIWPNEVNEVKFNLIEEVNNVKLEHVEDKN